MKILNSSVSYYNGSNFNGSTSVTSSADNCIVIHDNCLSDIVSHLQEDEIKDLADKIKSRGISENVYKCFLRSAIRCKHMSEDFLLDNYKDLEKDDIFYMHESDIMSQSYSRLALLMETK